MRLAEGAGIEPARGRRPLPLSRRLPHQLGVPSMGTAEVRGVETPTGAHVPWPLSRAAAAANRLTPPNENAEGWGFEPQGAVSRPYTASNGAPRPEPDAFQVCDKRRGGDSNSRRCDPFTG
jgi:hypothetical protein